MTGEVEIEFAVHVGPSNSAVDTQALHHSGPHCVFEAGANGRRDAALFELRQYARQPLVKVGERTPSALACCGGGEGPATHQQGSYDRLRHLARVLRIKQWPVVL